MSFEYLSGELVVESVATLNEATRADVGVASYQGAVHLAWTGSDYRINTMWSSDGYHFSGKQTLEQKSMTLGGSPEAGNRPGVPSLASGSSGLLMAWSCQVSAPTFPCVMWSDGGVTLVGQDKLHHTIAETPVAAWGDGAVVVWLTAGNKLVMARSQGNVFGQLVELGKAYPPLSVCTVGNELVVVSGGKGFRSNVNILWSQGGVFGQPINCSGVKAAKICALGNELAATWQQGRSRFLGFFRSGGFLPVLEMPKQRRLLSSEYPSLCEHNGGLVVAWPGDGGRINVARLRRA